MELKSFAMDYFGVCRVIDEENVDVSAVVD
jgi:hypothetical protein